MYAELQGTIHDLTSKLDQANEALKKADASVGVKSTCKHVELILPLWACPASWSLLVVNAPLTHPPGTCMASPACLPSPPIPAAQGLTLQMVHVWPQFESMLLSLLPAGGGAPCSIRAGPT